MKYVLGCLEGRADSVGRIGRVADDNHRHRVRAQLGFAGMTRLLVSSGARRLTVGLRLGLVLLLLLPLRSDVESGRAAGEKQEGEKVFHVSTLLRSN